MTSPKNVLKSPALERSHGIEILESRIAPAAHAVGTNFDYTDANGDVVTVRITGAAGSANFLTGGNDVDTTNGDIDLIQIEGPSADFQISFSDKALGDGDNIITLGEIESIGGGRVGRIRGITTTPTSYGATYNLEGYLGTTFSPGGGISLQGSLVNGADDLDLDILDIAADTSIRLRDGIAAGAVLDGFALRGSLFVGGDMAGEVNITSLFGRATFNQVSGVIDVAGSLVGKLTADSIAGQLHITTDLWRTGQLIVDGAAEVLIDRDLLGTINTGGSLTIDVGRNVFGATVNSGSSIDLTAQGGVRSSRLFAQDTLDASVGGSVISSTLIGNSSCNITTDIGSIIGCTISGGTNSVNLDIAGSIINSRVSCENTIDATVGGSVINSTMIGASSLLLTVGGNIVNSRLSGGTDTVDIDVTGSIINSAITSDSEINLTVGGSVINSNITSGTSLSLTVTGNILRSHLVSLTSSIDLDVTGSVIASTFIAPSDGFSGTIGGNVVGSRFVGGSNTIDLSIGGRVISSDFISTSSDINLTVNGGVISSLIDSGEDVNLEIADNSLINSRLVARSGIVIDVGNVLGGSIFSGNSADLTVDGAFSSTVHTAGDLTLDAQSIGGGSRLFASGDLRLDVATTVGTPRSGAIIRIGSSVPHFHVGGNLNAQVSVGENFAPDNNDIVGGTVTAGSVFSVGGDLAGGAGTSLVFGGAFLGRLEVGGSLLNDVTFQGRTNILMFGGGIGAALAGDNIADIIVNGALGRLSSASLFDRTIATTAGNFLDGTGATTGTLSATGGAPVVFPLA
jgi:hypothetical protein